MKLLIFFPLRLLASLHTLANLAFSTKPAALARQVRPRSAKQKLSNNGTDAIHWIPFLENVSCSLHLSHHLKLA